MKIWSEIPRVSNVYDKQKNISKVEKSSGVSSKKDVVSISNQAKDFQTVMRALKETPDIREDKVAELKDKYESGSLDVSGKAVMDKLFKSFKEEKA